MSTRARKPRPQRGENVGPRPHRLLRLPDGATAEVVDQALELRDGEGRLLVRYADGTAEICAPAGDLVLKAPAGRVVVESALDLELSAGRDLVSRAERRVELAAGRGAPQIRVGAGSTQLQSDRLDVTTKTGRFVAGEATVVARAIATTATHVVTRAERIEVEATRLWEKTRDTFRDVSGLAQTRVGRVRTLVKDVFSLHSRRAVLVSKEDTSIDGTKILLG